MRGCISTITPPCQHESNETMNQTALTLDPHLRVLGEFFHSATQHASKAMCDWTQGKVALELDAFRQVPLEEFDVATEISDQLLTMVVLGVQNFHDSCMLLAFDQENGRRLAASLLNRDVNPQPEWSKLEESAVMETANILGSAYFNELTRLTNKELLPSAPYLTHDFGVSVLEQAIMTQAMTSEQVLICSTKFAFNAQHLDWRLFFFPGGELLDAMNAGIQSAL